MSETATLERPPLEPGAQPELYLPEVHERVIGSGIEGGVSFPARHILTPEAMAGRNLIMGTVVADIELAEHYFAPKKSLSLVEADVKLASEPNGPVRRTLLLGMEEVDGKQQYVRSQLIDITNRLQEGDVVLDEEDARVLGMTNYSLKTAYKLTIARIKALQGYVIEQSEDPDFYCKVRASFPETVQDVQPVDEVDATNPEEWWDYTTGADRIAALRPELKRPQIGRDRRIEGGVYTTARDHVSDQVLGEIITLDEEYIKPYLDDYIADVFNRIGTGTIDDLTKANAAFNVVFERIKYSQEAVEELLLSIATEHQLESIDGRKVSLAYFMREGIGVCRHQALILGRMLESMIDQNLLQGEVSIDRNMIWNPKHEKYNGHAWVRYTTTDGTVYILDVAQGYFGTLQDSKKFAQWNYYRPGEAEQELPRA